MTQFIYYVPDGEDAPVYPFDGDPVSCLCMRGPDGARGKTLAAKSDGIGYHPDRQTWRQIPGTKAWVGYYTDKPMPSPKDLARKQQLTGDPVRLGDGHDWLVPVARRFVDADDGMVVPICLLPRAFELGDDGTWVRGQVLGRHKHLWDVAMQVWDAFNGSGMDSSDDWVAQSCACVLAANYRISEVEAGILGIIDDLSAREIMFALTDYKTFRDWVKKKAASDVLSGDSGQQGETQDSVQQ